jgi:uncharacterized membrane protein
MKKNEKKNIEEIPIWAKGFFIGYIIMNAIICSIFSSLIILLTMDFSKKYFIEQAKILKINPTIPYLLVTIFSIFGYLGWYVYFLCKKPKEGYEVTW